MESTNIAKVTESTESISLKLSNSESTIVENFNCVLLATGRIPNTSGLNLESAGVVTDKFGFIKVNDDYSTNINSIYAIGKASSKEIEKLNILNASLLAMKRAIKKLNKRPSHVLIDGNKLPNMKNYKLKSIIKGDQKIPSISAASIIAKVTRDKIISDLGKKFKGYNWQKNFGYGTSQHLKAIKILGITKHHRKTFSPINKLK